MKGHSGITVIPRGLDGGAHLLGYSHSGLVRIGHGADLKAFQAAHTSISKEKSCIGSRALS